MKCKEWELALEQDGLELHNAAARTHLAGCHTCQGLLTDFTAIHKAARELPAEAELPERLWPALRAQLAAEGILHETAQAEPAWWHSLGAIFHGRALAVAAVGLVLVAAATVQLRRTPAPAGEPLPYAETAAMLQQQELGVASLVLAGKTASPVDASLRENLKIVDQFITECEQRVRQEPGDDIAREYLSGAYQQKADVLAAMMDRDGIGE